MLIKLAKHLQLCVSFVSIYRTGTFICNLRHVTEKIEKYSNLFVEERAKKIVKLTFTNVFSYYCINRLKMFVFAHKARSS